MTVAEQQLSIAGIAADVEGHDADAGDQGLQIAGTAAPDDDILPPLPTEAEKPDAAIIGRRFDYTVVADDIAEQMRVAADRVHQMTRAAVIEVGRELLTIKSQIEHGRFIEWVERECGMSIRSAQRAMAAAEIVAKNDKLSYLPADGLLALAARSAPEPIVAEITGRIAAGERPTASEIKAKIATAKEEQRRAAEEAKLTARQRSARERRRTLSAAREEAVLRARAERQSKAMAAARSAATMLVTALGQRLGEFVALLDKADPWMVRVALREMKPVPAAAAAGNEAHQIDNGLQPPLPVPPPHAEPVIPALVI